MYGFIAVLHLVGWGLLVRESANNLSLAGLGLTAYLMGLRHAFDADHVAAVDDSLRYLLRHERRPLAIGFFFSLGHCTVVVCLAAAIIFASDWTQQTLPQLQHLGSWVGPAVSGSFLCLIGALNLVTVLDMFKAWRSGTTEGEHGHDHFERLLQRRGLLNRLFGRRLHSRLTTSWQLYPIGLLFGLGLDTALGVGALCLAAHASVPNAPVAAMLMLPILFTAGMSLLDTTDGVLMFKVYGWALADPQRKMLYNLCITALSVVLALVIGGMQLARMLIEVAGLNNIWLNAFAATDLDRLGYAVVGLFLLAWAISVGTWTFARVNGQRSAAGNCSG